MNNHDWEIVEESRQVVKEKYEDAMNEKTIEVFGLTNFCEQKIYINKDMNKDLKEHTLMHELLHCYIAEYCSIEQNDYNEEVMCDICANSHNIIHKIVEDYKLKNSKFKEVK